GVSSHRLVKPKIPRPQVADVVISDKGDSRPPPSNPNPGDRVTRPDLEIFSTVAKSTDRACLVVIYGPELGKRAGLGHGTFEIGRSSRSDLPIDQESISRHHARITFDGKH